MQHSQTKPADPSAIEAQEDALDRLLNDADAPFDPARVWQLLEELARAAKATRPAQ